MDIAALRGTLRKPSRLLIQRVDRVLDGVDLSLVKVGFATLAADPSRYCIERQVIAATLNVERCGRAFHRSFAVNAVHGFFLVRKSLSHSSGEGRYAVMTAR